MHNESPDVVAARLAAIVDSSDDAIISKTLDGVVTSWNRAAERLFGYTAAEAVGHNIKIIIPEERWDEEAEVLAKLRRGERVEHFDTVRRRKTGEFVNVSLTVSPVRAEDGTIVGASKIARDVTERMKQEAERMRLLFEAEAANKAKDNFLAMFGHELRNPLAAVASAADVIAVAQGIEELARPLDVISRQVAHLRRLIDDLLDAARVRTGKIALDCVPINLREAVEHAVTVLRAGPVRIRHVVDIDAEDVGTLADATRLEQIILNLLTNALKYTPAGRRITISVREDDGQAVLRVMDEGVGMTPDAMAHVFELFEQGEQTIDRSQGGLGIGLALVQTLVQLHGGSVEAASPGLGRGATFTVRLPLARLSPEDLRRSRPLASVRRRILIVEDNEDASEMLRTYLERQGHEVFVATDGLEGVEMASRIHPEVALVDLGLPSLDGLQVARQIRTQATQPRQLVALTGYGRPEDRQRCLAAGFDTHLVKPIDPAQLTHILEQ